MHMSCGSLGILISFFGSILMLPESFRLSKKNKEGSLTFQTGDSENITNTLFRLGIMLLASGFVLQFIDSLIKS
jgi:hypothetical protein